MRSELTEARFLRSLAAYLRQARWFLSEATPSRLAVRIEEYEELPSGEIFLWLIVDDGHRVSWSLPVVASLEGGTIDGPGLVHPLGPAVACAFVDATFHEEGCQRILPWSVRSLGRAEALSMEQSNTSLVIPGVAFVKLYRRLDQAPNREALLIGGLTRRNSRSSPTLLFDREVGGFTALVALEVLSGVDLWKELLDIDDPAAFSTRLAECADELGSSVGHLHHDLEASFGVRPTTRAASVATSLARAAEALGRVLDRDEAGLRNAGLGGGVLAAASAHLYAFDGARDGERTLSVQYIHGDLHLGQVLDVGDRLVFIDFEGEVLGEAVDAYRPREYDLAGILRSFAYAVGIRELTNLELLDEQTGDTLREASARFLGRYREVYRSGYDETVLGATLVEKAMYELDYELRASRGMVAIPLRFLNGPPGGPQPWVVG